MLKGIPGLGSLGDMAGMMKKAQEMQTRMAEMQEQLANTVVLGESGAGLVSFFENFRSQEVFSDARRYPYFRSHPLSSNRIESLRRYVQEQPHYDHRDSPERMAQHALILAKIHAFMDPPNTTLRAYPSSDVSLPGRYARAIAWYRDGQTDKALTAVDALIAEDPQNPYFAELKGQIYFEEGRPAEAVAGATNPFACNHLAR